MGGAFVAVADDSSATWWNPAGIAAGPFLDAGFGRNLTEAEHQHPARRETVGSFAFATPPFGFSYYRMRITGAGPIDPTGDVSGDRKEGLSGVPVTSFAASQIGFTLVHTIASGVHAGATFKYLRGTVRAGLSDSGPDPSDLLDAGDDLDGREADSEFDLDLGVHATSGAVSVAATVRNVRAADFSDVPGAPVVRLPRQVRIGAAFNGERIGAVPLVLAIDADLRRYDTVSGERRAVAVGAEHWFASRRVGVRGGARFNTVGTEDRVATGGLSVALRSGLYLDAYAAAGGDDAEGGWGVTARVSF
jgi:hypothetical protein